MGDVIKVFKINTPKISEFPLTNLVGISLFWLAYHFLLYVLLRCHLVLGHRSELHFPSIAFIMWTCIL